MVRKTRLDGDVHEGLRGSVQEIEGSPQAHVSNVLAEGTPEQTAERARYMDRMDPNGRRGPSECQAVVSLLINELEDVAKPFGLRKTLPSAGIKAQQLERKILGRLEAGVQATVETKA
jgi:hypothetical protein